MFEHPILFGVACGSIFALVHLVLGYGQKPQRRFKNKPARWKTAWALVSAVYMAVSPASNQTVPEFFITHFSFDQQSASYRVLIWQFGWGSVLNHPLFGTGLGEWDRPPRMPPNIDMFWLTHAIYYGILGGLLVLLTFFVAVIGVACAKGLSGRASDYRAAYVISMMGFFLAGWTVHFWNATYVLLLFLLGSGAFLRDLPATAPVEDLSERMIGSRRRAAADHAPRHPR